MIRSDLAGAARRPGRPGHRQDRGRAAPRGVPALHPPRAAEPRTACCSSGPNPLFLRYIEQVLPSLGETGVVLSTAGRALPRRQRGRTSRDADVAALKGDVRMARVLARAVRARQRVPNGSRRARRRQPAADPDARATSPRARARARRSRKPHNLAREGFLRDLLDLLAGRLASGIGTTLTERQPRGPARGAARLPRRAARAQPGLDAAERPSGCCADLLRRPGPAGGGGRRDLDRAGARAAAPRPRRGRGRSPTSRCSTSWPSCSATSRPATGRPRRRPGPSAPRTSRTRRRRCSNVDSADPADRRAARRPVRRERPGADRRRAGRVGPDLGLRPPGRRRGAGAVADDVAAAHAPLPDAVDDAGRRRRPGRAPPPARRPGARCSTRTSQGRWRLAELTVNYRTPAQVMRLATDVLAAAGIDAPAPESVREGEWKPVAHEIRPRRHGRRGPTPSGPSSSCSARAGWPW